MASLTLLSLMAYPCNLEVTHRHPDPETRQGYFPRHLLLNHLTDLPSCESYGESPTSNDQRASTSRSGPTWFPTQALYNLCTPSVNDRHSNRIQPKEATTSHSQRRSASNCGQPHHTDFEDWQINALGGYLSLAV